MENITWILSSQSEHAKDMSPLVAWYLLNVYKTNGVAQLLRAPFVFPKL